MRMVRFEDTYLYRFDGFGIPQWMPKEEATRYPTSKMAHAMKKIAKRYCGDAADIVVVKLKPKKLPIATEPLCECGHVQDEHSPEDGMCAAFDGENICPCIMFDRAAEPSGDEHSKEPR